MVEQRILEQSMRVRRDGAVTGWASLRWHGAAWFDGSADAAGTLLPVPLLRNSGARALDDGRATISRAQLAPDEREFVQGVWCTSALRATFDEVVRQGRLRPAVAAICMALAAGVTTLDDVRRYAATRPAWEGIPLYREAVALSNECFRSGPEVFLYLRWRLDAGFPEPLVNPPVFDLDGRLIGYPDLLDPVAGSRASTTVPRTGAAIGTGVTWRVGTGSAPPVSSPSPSSRVTSRTRSWSWTGCAAPVVGHSSSPRRSAGGR